MPRAQGLGQQSVTTYTLDRAGHGSRSTDGTQQSFSKVTPAMLDTARQRACVGSRSSDRSRHWMANAVSLAPQLSRSSTDTASRCE
eukprot:1094384-Pyramimonas_sp.AAC.1